MRCAFSMGFGLTIAACSVLGGQSTAAQGQGFFHEYDDALDPNQGCAGDPGYSCGVLAEGGFNFSSAVMDYTAGVLRLTADRAPVGPNLALSNADRGFPQSILFESGATLRMYTQLRDAPEASVTRVGNEVSSLPDNNVRSGGQFNMMLVPMTAEGGSEPPYALRMGIGLMHHEDALGNPLPDQIALQIHPTVGHIEEPSGYVGTNGFVHLAYLDSPVSSLDGANIELLLDETNVDVLLNGTSLLGGGIAHDYDPSWFFDPTLADAPRFVRPKLEQWIDRNATGPMVTEVEYLGFELLTAGGLTGDLDGDGFVGINDLNIVLGNWNQNVPPGDPLADPSGDGFVGIDDLNEVLGNWNAGTPPVSGSVPEPGSLVCLSVGVMLLGRRA